MIFKLSMLPTWGIKANELNFDYFMNFPVVTNDSKPIGKVKEVIYDGSNVYLNIEFETDTVEKLVKTKLVNLIVYPYFTQVRKEVLAIDLFISLKDK